MTLDDLDAELRRIGASCTGSWTYALTDLGSGQHIGAREDEVMPTASLIKVPVLVALYRAVAESRADLSARIRYLEEHRCLGSGTLIRRGSRAVDSTRAVRYRWFR